VERGHDLLVDGFYRHGVDVLVTEGLEKSFRICAISFVAYGVGLDGVRREQNNRMAEAPELSSPVMSRDTGLEENGGRLVLREEELEAGPGETMMFAHAAGVGGDSDFKKAISKTDFARSTAMVEWFTGGLLLSF
jgi:hypothetical protein